MQYSRPSAALAFAGCGGDDEAAATPAPTEAATEAAHRDADARRPPGAASKLTIAADPGGAKKFTETAADGRRRQGRRSSSPTSPSSRTRSRSRATGSRRRPRPSRAQDAPPLTVDLKPGDVQFYCPVGDHRAAGMEGKLTVK